MSNVFSIKLLGDKSQKQSVILAHGCAAQQYGVKV
jgi:hypothetical protein